MLILTLNHQKPETIALHPSFVKTPLLADEGRFLDVGDGVLYPLKHCFLSQVLNL